MDSSMYLYDVSPSLIETFCKIIDTGDDSLGWRGLAARIVPSWLEVRRTERLEAAGRSPTRELLWSWAQQNTTVGDLLHVLGDMGHYRALQLFQPQDTKCSSPSEGPPKAKDPPPTPGRNHKLVITYLDVVEGTRHFHHDMKISEGSFSEVYKGVKGSEAFAVKLFKQVKKASWRNLWDLFRREMEVHHLYQHPNIVELLGCFSEGDRYCLVYPYLPNGSLSHRLHDQDVESSLTWQERLDIIKGTAKAVHYLHMAQPCAVICGNITSTNILLDEALQPKLSDFQTARLRPHSVSQSSTITLDTVSRGTLGYLPEEYIRDGKLSSSVDVYSLGMVIMETLTGRKVIEGPKRTLLREVLSVEVEDSGSVESCLRYLDQRAGVWPPSASLCLFRLALDCTAGRALSRHNMAAVLQVLSQLLPLPCPPEAQPHTLDEMAPAGARQGPGPSPSPGPGPGPSIPVEDDELHSFPVDNQRPGAAAAQPRPCECSQSEVIFLNSVEHRSGEPHIPLSREEAGEGVAAKGQSLQTEGWSLSTEGRSLQAEGQGLLRESVDLYSSWPVQCSCSAEVGGLGCEDCRANGFTPGPSELLPQGDPSCPSHSVVENPAKQRLRDKIGLYNGGLIQSEELLSMTRE